MTTGYSTIICMPLLVVLGDKQEQERRAAAIRTTKQVTHSSSDEAGIMYVHPIEHSWKAPSSDSTVGTYAKARTWCDNILCWLNVLGTLVRILSNAFVGSSTIGSPGTHINRECSYSFVHDDEKKGSGKFAA
jgi:hypothetical protein